MVRHSSPKGKSITPEVATRLAPFRQPPLLEGEDEADYEQLRHRICAAVKPLDIFEEIFVADIINLEWEIWRWRRLKWSLIRARGLAALERFLPERLKQIEGSCLGTSGNTLCEITGGANLRLLN